MLEQGHQDELSQVSHVHPFATCCCNGFWGTLVVAFCISAPPQHGTRSPPSYCYTSTATRQSPRPNYSATSRQQWQISVAKAARVAPVLATAGSSLNPPQVCCRRQPISKAENHLYNPYYARFPKTTPTTKDTQRHCPLPLRQSCRAPSRFRACMHHLARARDQQRAAV